MPGLRVFGRRWGVASDDLVFPGSFEFFVRAIWWIVMLVLYTGQRTELSHCEGGATLSTFLLGNIVILLAVLLVLACIVYTSMQGTISNHYKRRRMPSLVYGRTLLYAPELVWTLLGSTWSVRLRSVADCGDEALTAMKGAVATSWMILLATLVMVALAFDPLGGHGGTRGLVGGGADSVRLLRSARRVWETRVRLMCCWLRHEEHGGAFSEIARVLSDFFLDTDLVASDIAAGLSLLHQQQDRQVPGEAVTEGPLSLIAQPLESISVELDSAAHYAKFAWAAYGWPMYVLQNPLSGLSMFFKNCSCRRGEQRGSQYSLVGGGDGGSSEGRNTATVLRVAGLRRSDLIHVSFHNALYEIPFFVALDHDRQAVVVSVRGTLSLRDVLTNLSADCESVRVEGVEQDSYAHKGLIQAATYIHQRLVNDGILDEAFLQAQDYRLVLTGHSMGGGVAVLLSILLRPTYPELRCYAFSPPGGLVSKTLAHRTHEFVLTVVVGKDVVPRLSLSNMEDLKQSILQIIAASNRPKYQILLLGCCYEVCGVSAGAGDDAEEEQEVQRTSLLQPLLSTGDLSEDQQPMVCTAWAPPPDFTLSLAPSSGLDPAAGPPASVSLPVEASLIAQRPPLFLPGRILHIVRDDGDDERGCVAGGARRFHARWEDPAAFRSLLISPRMFSDHTPHAIARALRRLAGPAERGHAAPGGGGGGGTA